MHALLWKANSNAIDLENPKKCAKFTIKADKCRMLWSGQCLVARTPGLLRELVCRRNRSEFPRSPWDTASRTHDPNHYGRPNLPPVSMTQSSPRSPWPTTSRTHDLIHYGRPSHSLDKRKNNPRTSPKNRLSDFCAKGDTSRGDHTTMSPSNKRVSSIA